jgi:hypothetical protein
MIVEEVAAEASKELNGEQVLALAAGHSQGPPRGRTTEDIGIVRNRQLEVAVESGMRSLSEIQGFGLGAGQKKALIVYYETTPIQADAAFSSALGTTAGRHGGVTPRQTISYLVTRGEKTLEGHWTCLILHQDEKKVEWFDPYGFAMDTETAESRRYRALSTITKKFCEETNFSLEQNTAGLQRMRPGVSTCGRWVGVRLRLRHLPLSEFVATFNVSPTLSDWIITALTATIVGH